MGDFIGFRVRISPAGEDESDDAWETFLGGGDCVDDIAVELPLPPGPASSAQESINEEIRDARDRVAWLGDTVAGPTLGHRFVGEITLRGAMTDKRSALCSWINDTVNGKPWKRTLTITELISEDGVVREGTGYVYVDCMITRYVFPRLSVSNTAGNVMEEVRIKPVRCELK